MDIFEIWKLLLKSFEILKEIKGSEIRLNSKWHKI